MTTLPNHPKAFAIAGAAAMLCALSASHAYATNTPGFATLDRADSGSRVEAAVGSSLFQDGPTWVARTDLYAQFSASTGEGLYLAVPYSFVVDELNSSGLGNLELGGLYTSQGLIPVALRAGIVINSAGDNAEAFEANALAGFGRLTDGPATLPDRSWLRLAVSPMTQVGSFFFRLDTGFDIPMPEYQGRADTLMRFNFGAGYRWGGAAATLELVSVGTTGDVRSGDRFLQALTLGVRSTAGKLRPFGALSVPIGEVSGDLYAVLTFGLQWHFEQ